MNLAKWLFLLFLGLKLTDYIDWPWWLVAMPMFIDLGFRIIGKMLEND